MSAAGGDDVDASVRSEGASDRRHCILFVDDEPGMLKAFERLLHVCHHVKGIRDHDDIEFLAEDQRFGGLLGKGDSRQSSTG